MFIMGKSAKVLIADTPLVSGCADNHPVPTGDSAYEEAGQIQYVCFRRMVPLAPYLLEDDKAARCYSIESGPRSSSQPFPPRTSDVTT
jgi:hypothetical protein